MAAGGTSPSHQLMRSPLSRRGQSQGVCSKLFWGGQWGKPLSIGLWRSLGCTMGCSGSHRDPASAGAWRGEMPPTMEVPSPKRHQGHTGCQQAGTQPQGGSQRGSSPGNSPGSMLGRPQHPPWLETSTMLLPSGRCRQLPVLMAKGGCSCLQGHHHLSPLMTVPCIPAGSQPCFSSELEDKTSPGRAGREHGVQTAPRDPSCPPPHPSPGVPAPSPRTPGRSQPRAPAPCHSPLPATAAPGSPRVPGRAMPQPAPTEAGRKRQRRTRRQFPEFVCKGVNNPR